MTCSFCITMATTWNQSWWLLSKVRQGYQGQIQDFLIEGSSFQGGRGSFCWLYLIICYFFLIFLTILHENGMASSQRGFKYKGICFLQLKVTEVSRSICLLYQQRGSLSWTDLIPARTMSAQSGFMGKKGRPAILKVSGKSRSNGNRLGASSLTLALLAKTFFLHW